MFKKGHKKIPGSGKQKGQKCRKTIEKEAALEAYQQEILNEMKPLVRAHFAVAKGTQIMIARDWIIDPKTKKRYRGGRYVKITKEKEIIDLLNSELEEGDEYYAVFTQDPNPKALEDLMNRVFGKAKEQIEPKPAGKMIILDK